MTFRGSAEGCGWEPSRSALALLSEAMGYTNSAALRAAAALGVADHMAETPRPLDELAAATECDPAGLRRVLRLLTALGIVEELGAQRFRLTELGTALRSDAPHSARAAILMLTDDLFWHTAHVVSETIRSAVPSISAVLGCTTGDYFAARPDKEALFYQGMEQVSGAENRLVADACPLPDTGTVADIGGRYGALLREVLLRRPSLRGVLFDKPEEVRRHRLDEAALVDRVEVLGGDFFTSVPPADSYLLKRIVHNCDDEQAVRLLDTCRRAMRPGGHVLVIDAVVPPDGAPHDSKAMDFMMLGAVTGAERSLDELEPLVEQAGLSVMGLIPTPTPMSIVVTAAT